MKVAILCGKWTVLFNLYFAFLFAFYHSYMGIVLGGANSKVLETVRIK